MIAFLLTSSLLLLICLAVYFGLVRRWATPLRRRQYLLAGTAASLLIAIWAVYAQPSSPDTQRYLHGLAFSAPIPEAHLQQYCSCTQPDYSHRLLFRTHTLYNFVLSKGSWLMALTLLAGGIVMIRALLQLAFLRHLIQSGQSEDLEIDGHRIRLLIPNRPLSVGAFWLGKAYIIWQDGLDTLSDAERTAVFRHELSHIRQGNTLEKIALNLLQCLWWFHPGFYVLRRELNLLSEHLADEAALGQLPNRKSYAQLLLRLADQQQLPIVSAFRASKLELRIRHILSAKQKPSLAPVLLLLLLFPLEHAIALPFSSAVDSGIRDLHTYEDLIYEVPLNPDPIIFCPDCETVCKPNL